MNAKMLKQSMEQDEEDDDEVEQSYDRAMCGGEITSGYLSA